MWKRLLYNIKKIANLEWGDNIWVDTIGRWAVMFTLLFPVIIVGKYIWHEPGAVIAGPYTYGMLITTILILMFLLGLFLLVKEEIKHWRRYSKRNTNTVIEQKPETIPEYTTMTVKLYKNSYTMEYYDPDSNILMTQYITGDIIMFNTDGSVKYVIDSSGKRWN